MLDESLATERYGQNIPDPLLARPAAKQGLGDEPYRPRKSCARVPAGIVSRSNQITSCLNLRCDWWDLWDWYDWCDCFRERDAVELHATIVRHKLLLSPRRRSLTDWSALSCARA